MTTKRGLHHRSSEKIQHPSILFMDAIFSLDVVGRTSSLHLLMQNFGATYICIWSYLPQPTHCLWFLDGYFKDAENQPSSSSGSLARRLFYEYKKTPIFILNERVPGRAFSNNNPYLELNELQLKGTATIDVQLRFYEEARIKSAVFMGCRSGEIELGWSNVTQVNMENEMRTWFMDIFPRQSSELSQALDPNRPSSSSSSLKSLSNIDSPDCSSLLFNIPSTSSHMPETLQDVVAAPPLRPTSSTALQATPSTTRALGQVMQTLQPLTRSTTPFLQQLQSRNSPQEQALQAFMLTSNIRLPTRESEEAAMTRAYLAILSSPSSSSAPYQASPGAFKKYTSALPPTTPMRPASLHRKTMLKRAITFYRRFNIARREHMLASRHAPTSTQLHHMISERKRREKINESFQALRSLLPPDAKKDKASVLTRTREYLTSLKAQVEELNKKNKQLEAQLSSAREAANEEASLPSNERVDIRIRHVQESTSEQRILDLQVSVRGECSISDMVIRLLGFLKQVDNVNLISIEASTHVVESQSFNRVILRVNVEGNDWDEAAFQEAVKRVVSDLPQ